MSILRSFTLAAGVALLSAVPATAAVHLPTVQRTLTASAASASCQGASTATTTYTAPLAGFVTVRLNAAGGEWDLYLADAQSRKGLSQSRAFGATEVTQTWVTAGQKLLISACRTAGRVSTAAVAIDFADAVKPGKSTASIVRIPRVSQQMFNALTQAGFDPSHNQGKNFIEFLIPNAGELERFKKTGVPFKVRIKSLEAVDANARAAESARARAGYRGLVPSGRTTYRFLADYQEDLAKIIADNPEIARPVQLGLTYQGRPIQGVEFSQNVGATDDGKPTYFVMGVHHAREWPSSEIAMEFATLIANKYGAPDAEGAKIADLLAKERIVIVPILNVDGFVASRGEWAGQTASGQAIPDPEDETIGQTGEPLVLGGAFAYRRKNCDGSVPSAGAPEHSLPCYYAHGVDPNRNYGFDWGGPGASNDPLTQVYRGTGQWSEPETQAAWRFFQSRPVTTMLTLHTIAALVLRSPGLHTNGLAPDEVLLRELGDKMAGHTGYKSQYGWELYDTTGTTEDWNYGAAGALGYTIEIGPKGGVFHGDYKTAVEDQWNGPKVTSTNKTEDGTKITGGGMKAALLTAAAYAIDPKTHSILTGTGTGGAQLELKKTFTTDSSPICTFAQGLLVAGGALSPVDCVAPGQAPGELGKTSKADGLTYTTQIPAGGSFTWHVTQSTRPFKGYTFRQTSPAGTKKPKGFAESNGTKESWTLTCKVDGTVVGAQNVVVERGETKVLGNVCNG